jgi:putative ABC transport system permease protein
MIFDLWRDVVYAVRTLAKSPSLTAVALLAIALAIGANTAVYSVIDALIHFPIPSDDPAHTALVFSENPEGGVTEGGVSTDDYLDWRESATLFEEIVATRSRSYNLVGAG